MAASDTTSSLHGDDDKLNLSELDAFESETVALNRCDEMTIQQENERFLNEIGSRAAYRKLNLLLEKSNIYAELILARMNQEHEKAVKNVKLEKRAENVEKSNDDKKNDVTECKPLRRSLRCTRNQKPTVESSTKRKRAPVVAKDVKIECLTDYFDENDLQAKRKKCADEAVSLSTLSTKNVSFECDLRYFTGGTLRDYQIEGLCWLKTQYEQGINGILADEMGLGKTIQCIALLCHFYAKEVRGPFLVVGPLSTLPNWRRELKRFAPKLPVVLYHGAKDTRIELQASIRNGYNLNGIGVRPVILTSYEILMSDCAFLSSCCVRFLVLDEGHRVKNSKCKLLRALRKFDCSRLLMTGTPLQNNLAELWSLLNFLLPEIFTDLDWFETFFAFHSLDEESSTSNVEERERQILNKLHAILKPFLLRRTKDDVELQLPCKREIWVYAPMTSLQLKYYKATVEKYILQMSGKDEEHITVHGKRRSILRPETMDERENETKPKVDFEQNLNPIRNPVMLLRKICLHPYLAEYPLTESGEYLIDEQLIRTSGKLMVFDRLVTALIERKHKILVFTQFVLMLNILHDYCYFRKLDFCRLDGTMALEDRESQIDCFAKDENVHLFLISTRAGGLGLNLTAADTVIIFDSDWNPQVDLQAQDRCHRIGQAKPVLIYRLICRGTVDERIVKVSATKRKLEKMVIHAGKFEFSNQKSTRQGMTSEDLLKVLQSTDYNQIWEVNSDDASTLNAGVRSQTLELVEPSQIISEKDLASLLDREKCDDSRSRAFDVMPGVTEAF